MSDHTSVNGVAAEMGRRGGLKGGRARAEALTAEQRSELARNAASARWHRDCKGYANPRILESLEKALEAIDAEIAQLRIERSAIKRILAEQKAAVGQ